MKQFTDTEVKAHFDAWAKQHEVTLNAGAEAFLVSLLASKRDSSPKFVAAEGSIFDQYGNLPQDGEEDKLSHKIGDMAGEQFKQLLVRGVSVVEVRALATEIAGMIQVVMSEAVLGHQMERRQRERATRPPEEK